MKILQIAPRYYPSIGGVEETVKQYATRLSSDFGHNVQVLTSDIDSDSSRQVDGVDVNRLWTLPFFKSGPFSPIVPLLPIKLLSQNADLWHLHANKRFTTDSAALVNIFKKTPFVYSTHAGMFGTSWLGRMHNNSIGRLALNAGAVIFGTNFEKNLVEDSGIKIKNPFVLPIGVDLSEFENANLEIMERYDLKNKKVILFVGRLTKHKGLDTLIKSLPKIIEKEPSSQVVAVGPDFGEKVILESMAKELGVADNVIFTGPLARNDLLGAYKKAAVFCLPSRSEAFGIVMIEAMAAGTVVVAADNTAMPEIINHGVNGLLFDTENSIDLADKIKLLLGDEKLKEKLTSNSAADVAEKYNWKNIVEKLNRIYIEVAGK